MKKKVYTTREVGRFCGVDLTTVINWVKNGKISAYRTAGGHRRIKHEDLIEFMNKYSIPVPVELTAHPGLNILLTVKEQADYDIITQTIAELNMNYKVETAADSFEVGYKLAIMKPDIIIIDIDYPQIDGHRVLKKIREIGFSNKIIALKKSDSSLTTEALKETGADIILAKPLQLEQLKQTLRESGTYLTT